VAAVNITRYDRPLTFYTLATALPWAFWLGAGYVSHITPHDDRYLDVASVLALTGLLSPMAVAYWLISRNSELRSDVLHRFIALRSVKPVYLLLAFTLMPASILLAQAISLLLGYSASQFVITGHFSFSSGVFPVWFLLVMAPTIEELAWHSYGTDCLRNRMNLFWASLVFGAYWGIWHIPLATIRDYYQSNVVETGWVYGANFLVSIIPFVLLMNWIYYKSNRNILITIVFHVTAGFFNEIFATHPDSKIIQTVLLSLFAAAVVIRDKAFFLRR